MASSRAFKVWLWDSGASTWREVDKFTGFKWSYTLNFVPKMEMTAYATTTNLQNLMKAGVPFRITNTESDDGTVETGFFGESFAETGAVAGSREIFSGRLSEPKGDEKTARDGTNPIIWEVTGSGWAADLDKSIGDTTTAQSGSASTVVDAYIDATAATVTKGTRDTGDSINVKFRDQPLLRLLIDVAGLGDTTTDFLYYVHVDGTTNGRANPRVHYLSNANALFETDDPSGGIDNGRVLTRGTDTRSLEVVNEDDRLRNAIKVRYKGIGSGSSQSDTGFVTDSTSITNFGRQEHAFYAPWIQDSATANMYAQTLLNMFKGESDDGIKRATAALNKPDLFTSDFDAIPGDRVAIERTDGTKVMDGILFGYSYDQMREETVAHIGLPRVPFAEDVARTARQTQQTTSSMEQTVSNTENKTSPVSIGPSTVVDQSSVSMEAAAGTTDTVTLALSTSESDKLKQAHLIMVEVTLNNNGTNATLVEGPIKVQVRIRENAANDVTRVFDHTFCYIPNNGNPLRTRQTFPFAPLYFEGQTLDDFQIIMDNHANSGTFDGLVHVTMDVRDEHTIPLDHVHKF